LKREIKTGDLLACSGNAIYSKIIRKWGGFQNWVWNQEWTEDEITHVGLAIWINFPNHGNRLCIFEAHALKGIRLNPLDLVLNEYHKTGGKIYHQELIGLSGDLLAQEALKHWTKPYPSIRQFIIAGLKSYQWVRKHLNLPLDVDVNEFHCSELVTQSLIDIGVNYKNGAAVTTPQQVSGFPCFGSLNEIKQI